MKREGWRTVKESRVGLVLLVLLCLGCAFALGVVFWPGQRLGAGGVDQLLGRIPRLVFRRGGERGGKRRTDLGALGDETREHQHGQPSPAGDAARHWPGGWRKPFSPTGPTSAPLWTTEQLMEVPGIGEKRYAAVEKLICVEENAMKNSGGRRRKSSWSRGLNSIWKTKAMRC